MRSVDRGFAVLEAIVALVLIASTGIALIQWLQHGLETLSRVETLEREIADRDWALSMLQTRPLIDQPEGELTQGDLKMRWATQRVLAAQRNATPGGVEGPWALSLVELKVSLMRPQARDQEFLVRMMGKRRVVPIDLSPPL